MTTHDLKAAIEKYASPTQIGKPANAPATPAIPAPVAPIKPMAPGVSGTPAASAAIAPSAATPPAAPKTPATPVTLPTERGAPTRAPAYQSRPTPNAPAGSPGRVDSAAPLGGRNGPAGPAGPGAAPVPSLTGPEATQPNPQGGPSAAQKPPTQVLNTEEVQAAPGTAPLGHVSENEQDDAYLANPDLYDRDPAAAVREYRASKQQPATAPQTQPSGPATAPTTAPAAAAPKTQPAPAAGYSGSADKAFADIMPKLSDDKVPVPERQQLAMSAVNKHVQSNPQLLQGMQDIQAGRTDTEAAKVFQSQIDNAQNQMIKAEFEKLKQANPGANLSDPSTWSSMMGEAANTAMSKFNEMPFEHKMLTGLGLGGGLIGILSSLFGGGGMAGGLLGVLGLAAGGVAGAAGGMFGNQAQAMTGKMMGDVGNFLGFIPDEARDASNFNEAAAQKTKDRIAEAMTATMSDEKTRGQGAQIGQQMLMAERAKFEPLRNLHQTSPQAAYSYLMGMKNGPKTPEEAAQLYARLNQQYDLTGQEGYLYSQTLDAIRQRQQNPQTWQDRAMSFLKPEDVMTGLGFQIPAEKGASMNIAQKIVFKQAVQKAARCWAGYEPVPGKAPYSENSCRPKSKKKKPSKEPAK